MGLFTLTFDRAPSWGWLSAPTVIGSAGSLVALAVFVVVEKRVRWPRVDLSLVQNPRFTVLVIAGTIAGVGVAVFGTVLEMLQRAGMSPAGAVDAIGAVPAALLLPAGVVVLLTERASNSRPATSGAVGDGARSS